MHTSINNCDTGTSCVLTITQKPSAVLHKMDLSLGYLLLSAHSFKEMYYVEIKQAQYTPVSAQNKLLAIRICIKSVD